MVDGYTIIIIIYSNDIISRNFDGGNADQDEIITKIHHISSSNTKCTIYIANAHMA